MIQAIIGCAEQSDDKLSTSVHDALWKLPGRSRKAIVLRVFDGLSSKEIGVRMNTSPRAVDLLIFRAKKRLRKLLSDYADNELNRSCDHRA